MNKKVLIITYYWPPAGGPGVQRVLKFVKYLPEFGWDPIILTVEDGEYPAIDNSLLNEVPAGLKVYKSKVFSPLKIYKRIMGIKGNIPTHVLSKSKNESLLQKIFKWIRINLYLPDGRRDWIRVIGREGVEVVRREEPDLIFSTSPPNSVQLGALKLAEATGKKWVADMRDPWTDGFWLKNLPRAEFAKRKDLKLEMSVLRRADAITTISRTWIEMFSKKARNKYYALPNGYDHQDFENALTKQSETFKIIHAGSMRSSQIPHKLFEDLVAVNANQDVRIELHLFGTLHEDAISLIEELGISEYVVIHGYIDHSELIGHLKGAQILLMLVPDTEDNTGILPGKLFEYIGSGNYILGIGPRKGEAEQIILEYGIGAMRSFDESCKSLLLEQYDQWIRGVQPAPAINISKYSRKDQAGQLAKIFNDIL